MGNILSLCIGPSDFTTSADDWKNWDGHPAARHYLVGKQLGSGGFSEVYLAKRKPILFDGEEVALKVIFLGNPQLAEAAKELLKAEATVLKRLHHPHVVDVRRTYLWPRKQILVIEEEMLRGQDLLTAAAEAITDHGFNMTESFAARAIRQVLEVLAYLHSRRVLHRDVKAENLRLTRSTREWVADMSRFHIKLIDFGLSCVLGDVPEAGWLGTPGYVAPEVIDCQPHTPAMDLFSAGVILFILLTGMKPVDNEDALKLSYSHLEAAEYPNMVGNARWDAVSSKAQSLVLALMERDPRKRLSAPQALEHPFLKKGGKVPDAAVAALAAPAKAAGDASAAAAAPPAASAAVQQQRKEAAEMKESDRLQVDGTMVRQTLEAERWRELIQLVMSLQAVAGGSPTSQSSAGGAPTDVEALLQKALRRGYARERRGQFSIGRTPAAPTPRPELPRSFSMPSLRSPRPPAAMLPPLAVLGELPPRGGSPDAAGPAQRGGLSRCQSAAAIEAATRGQWGSGQPRHERAVARETLDNLLEEDMMEDPAFVQDLQQLEVQAAAAHASV